METHCNRLKQIRERHGLSGIKLAEVIGISPQHYYDLEKGERRLNEDILKRVADFFNVSVDYLLGRSDDPYTAPTGIPGAIPMGPAVKVPILGTIKAGEPMYAEENIEGWTDVPEEQAKSGRHFFLRVKGDSMIESGIKEGCLVLVREQPDVEDGDIAVVMIDNEEATLKRVYRADGKLILKADNPNYPPMLVDPKRARIVGRVVEARLKF